MRAITLALTLPDGASRPARAKPTAFGWVRAGLGCAAAIAALVLLARESMRQDSTPAAIRPVRPAVLLAPAPVWHPIPDPKPRFAIDLPELRGIVPTLEARRHANGGREDKLVYGVFESDRPYLRLALFRGPPEAGLPASFFLDLARRAGEAGLAVVRSARIATLETKLGPLETAEVVLADSFERACLAFRLQSGSELSAQGWRCAGPEPQERADPACIIDRLGLLPTADDPSLKALVQDADRRRNPSCGPSADAKRKTAAAPPIRNF
jgi:hypothetical protein